MQPLIYRQATHFPMMPYMHGPIPQRLVNDEEDLASVSFQLNKKRFYVDVKKNRRGIFMKVAEVGPDGRKARILITMPAAVEIKDKLKDLIEVLDTILKKNSESDNGEITATDDGKPGYETPADGLIKSHIINSPNRRYFLDLKHNKWGYFLRLTMLSTVIRTQVVVPSEGLNNFYSTMESLLKKWWDGPSAAEERKNINLPESKFLRVDNKTLYFDSSSNNYGAFLRISEVRAASRTAITIPCRSLSRFRDIINEIAEGLANVKVKKNDPATETNEAEPSSDNEESSQPNEAKCEDPENVKPTS